MILVTGATGLNGQELVRRLSAMGVPVRAMVRNRAKAQGLVALPHVEIVDGDLARPETLVAALRGIERAMLISSSVPEMLDVQTNFIDAAKKAGVKHVVKLSGIFPDLNSAFRFARMHGEAEKRLEASGMAFTHLRACEFMPSYFRQVPNILGKGAMFLPMEDARIASIDVGDIADVAVLTLTRPGHEGKIYPLTGPEALSMSDVAAKLSAVTGKPIRYVNVPPEAARQAQIAAGVPEYLTDALVELFAERRRGGESKVYPTFQELTGRKPTTFDEFVRRNVAIFRGDSPAPRR
ncbi:MAG: SDR family oxidoreductase [Xanthobacteraceae bacterium]